MKREDIHAMSEEERRYFNENVPYDRGFEDGVHGNKQSKGESDNEWYTRGFEMGRKRLRDDFQRSMLNDYGHVSEQA